MFKVGVKYFSIFLITFVCKRSNDYTENEVSYFSLFSCNGTCRTKIRRNDAMLVNYVQVFYIILAFRSLDLSHFTNANLFSYGKVKLLYVLLIFQSHLSHHSGQSFVERINQRVIIFCLIGFF